MAPNRQYRFSRESVGAPNILLYAFQWLSSGESVLDHIITSYNKQWGP